MNRLKKSLKIFLPVLIVAAGFAAMNFLEHMRKPPSKKGNAYQGVLVEVVRPRVESYVVKVTGTGIVHPRREISVVPQVSGRIEYISDKFIQGGRFREGEVFFRIEDVDYRLALSQAQSILAQSRLNLTIEKTRGAIARQDLQNIRKESDIETNPLILREPQREAAEASMDAAEAAVRQAEINLERTVIKAPFNCIVKTEHVDIGQYVHAGSAVADVFGADMAEVIVPIPLDELEWINIPGHDHDSTGSEVEVIKKINGNKYKWTGYVSRILGDVDPRGRMARVVVEIKDPFSTRTGSKNLRLYEGMFVDVVIGGSWFDRVFILPSGVLREESTVWLMGKDHRLVIRKVDVFRTEKGNIILRSGVDPDDLVVLSDINGAAPGMLLRVGETKKGGGSVE